ncbi:MAG: hypothetical protein WD271_14690 [Acidimicrobiia bacterium]
MWEVVERAEIAARPGRVWRIVSDIEGHVDLAGSGEVRAIRIDGPLAAGTSFEGDIAVGEVGSFVSRNTIDIVDEARELAWTSFPPLDDDETEDHQIEVHWWFRLAPSWNGTELEHGFRVAPPRAGAVELAAFLERTDRLTTVRRGMVATLANVKARAEK